MGWKFDQPLQCLSDEAEQKKIIEMWESEKYGGLSSGNNRLPLPFTFLIAMIVVTAFLVTMPIWGQRPKGDNYVEFVAHMDDPEVQQIEDPKKKIEYLYNLAYAKGDSRTKSALERHPLTWDDLLNIAPAVREIQAGGGKYDLGSYNVLGDRLALANHEGNWIGEGDTRYRERKQPWWDRGYTIDVFYVTYFMITAVIIVKRLPHFSRKPNMSKAK